MKCPVCNYPKVKTVDTRPYSDDLKRIRKKKCPSCGVRFHTYEWIDMETIKYPKTMKEGAINA